MARQFARIVTVAAGAILGSMAPLATSAETYPSRPITIVVPFPPGGPGDTVGRILAEHMRSSLGQPIIIENVSGAAGTLGTGRVARAAPDGYTLVLGYWGTHVANAAIYPLSYDVVSDFAPIALLPSQPMIIVGRASLPAHDLKGLIAWLKENPGAASQGTAGVGSIGHVAGMLLQKESGTRYQLVPYRGAAPAMQDLVAGQIDLSINVPVTSIPQIRAGLIRPYAVTAKSRLAIAPDIPTVDEAGLPGLHLSLWLGLWAPKGTPASLIALLNKVIAAAMDTPATREKLTAQGFEIWPRESQTPEALAAFQKAEIERWWPIIKAAKITGE